MIPISDNFPSQKVPFVTRTLVIINVFVFFQALGLGREINEFYLNYGLVPAKYTSEYISKFTLYQLVVPFFTSLFLHGGIIHLLGNMLTLWIFGDNVEDRLGHAGFLIFYIAMGLVANFAQLVSAPGSEIPIIGASGAIAGVMGAYFIFYPKSRVVLLVPIFIIIDFWEVPAYTFFVFWFLLQFFSGAMSLMGDSGNFGGVAWWAHIGGFVGGMLLALTVYRKKKKKKKTESFFRVK